MASSLEVGRDGPGRTRVQRHVTNLAALAAYLQVLDATSLLDVGHAQSAQLGAVQAFVQQGGQDRMIALAAQGGGIGNIQQRTRLVVTGHRRLTFPAVHPRTFTPSTGLPVTALDSHR